MTVFDTKTWDTIVIVPPKPDASLSQHEDFSYLHLYNFDDLDANYCNSGEKRGSVGTAKTCSVSSIGSSGSSSSSEDLAYLLDKADDAVTENGTASYLITRDPRNGAFTFSVNAEYDLLLHIQRSLDDAFRSSGSAASVSDIESSKIIMKSIDEYCLKKQWMYHVGMEKSRFISKFLERSIDAFVERNDRRDGIANKKFVCVELGTYCGYSALVLASTLRQAVLKYGQDAFDFHIYTTEVSSKLLNVAMSIFRLAKMKNYVSTILVQECDPLSTTLKKHLPDDSDGIDFLLLDHAKPMYLPDLMDLESARLLRKHSFVAADNVIFNRLDGYRNHMKRWEAEGFVETNLEEMNLEYSNNLKDGIEMTVYLRDLP
mmetsp:Transcript_9713/g.18065  ORF Transcript_9713/g.18065 Transcript_9713/m.18065 type:complete len:373 (+) Transcript_9713:85-1203(+)